LKINAISNHNSKFIAIFKIIFIVILVLLKFICGTGGDTIDRNVIEGSSVSGGAALFVKLRLQISWGLRGKAPY